MSRRLYLLQVSIFYPRACASLGISTEFADKDATAMRAVAVDARGILEALDKVYGAGHLVQELRGK